MFSSSDDAVSTKHMQRFKRFNLDYLTDGGEQTTKMSIINPGATTMEFKINAARE